MKSSKKFVWVLAVGLALSACGSTEPGTTTTDVVSSSVPAATESSDVPADAAVEDLPIVDLFEDEDGPADLAGMVREATMIFEARVVEVESELRYYGPTAENQETTAFEQVGLVLEPTNVLKGDVPARLTVRWTSYVTEDARPGAQRLGRVSVDGLIINERARGQRFGIFIHSEVEPGVFDVLTTTGIVPINPAGRLTNRQGLTASDLYSGWIGGKFEDMVVSVQ